MPGPDPPGGSDLLELRIGPVAHGGHCVARHDGRVVFVRHALPGELVRARLVEAGEHDRFWRADAVEVLQASPDRVPVPCELAGPGGCGGCDWQHASIEGQRALKRDVVREQLTRLGRLPAEHPLLAGLRVEPVPGDADGLGWRTRVRFAVDAAGQVGLRRHRSHDVIAVPHCPIAHPEVSALEVGRRRWPRVRSVEVVAAGVRAEHRSSPTEPLADDQAVQRLVLVEPADPTARVELPPLAAEAAVGRRDPDRLTRLRGRTWVTETVTVREQQRRFRVTGAGFWQVHPGAAQVLLDAVLEGCAPRTGELALDLYCGVGLFAAGLAAAVGPTGLVIGVESDLRAGADARRSLYDVPWVRFEQGRVGRVLAALAAPDGPLAAGAQLVVLDPPRSGAGADVIRQLVALRPRVICYVACDPAALGRDLATATVAGYRLAGLRAFDAFPMTHHVECVATLVPAGGSTDSSGPLWPPR